MLPSGPHRGRLALIGYILLSLCFAVVLVIDPLIDRPSGLIKLRWFTSKPLSHGQGNCSWDYEGSWAIGLARGAPDPLKMNISADAVITCATLANLTAVSFVADPFLYRPDNTTRTPMGNFTTGAGGTTPWFAFYEMKNLKRYIGELGVAVSYDSGGSWRHLGTALSEPFHLSFPLVMYDTATQQYLMIPETSGAREGAVRVYSTSAEAFPFGWRLAALKRPYDRGWPATRRWFQFGAPAKYVDTAPVWFRDRWWIFTTRYGTPAARQPKYTLLLYTADSILGEWMPHPANDAGVPFALAPGGRVPYGIDTSSRTARNGGRPFVMDGALYRWAQDCSHYYGGGLVLMRADVASNSSYREIEAARYEPRRDGLSWNAERLHHADVQPLPDGSWVGLVDGDRYADGKAHFFAREQWFVDFKAELLRLVVLQLLIVIAAVALLYAGRTAWSGWRGPSGVSGGGASRQLLGFPALFGNKPRRGMIMGLVPGSSAGAARHRG